MSTMLKDKCSNDPRSSVIDNRRKKQFFESSITDAVKKEKSRRVVRLHSCIATLHAAQNNSVGNGSSLGWNRLMSGVILYSTESGRCVVGRREKGHL